MELYDTILRPSLFYVLNIINRSKKPGTVFESAYFSRVSIRRHSIIPRFFHSSHVLSSLLPLTTIYSEARDSPTILHVDIGNERVTFVPSPGLLVISRVPPCWAMMSLQMNSPRAMLPLSPIK